MKNNIWYAVMMDKEDSDWGTGSFDLNEAMNMVREYRANGYSDAYIAVIDENDGYGAVCIDEIHDLEVE